MSILSISVYRPFCLSTFLFLDLLFVDLSVCRPFCLSTFAFVGLFFCRPFSQWPDAINQISMNRHFRLNWFFSLGSQLTNWNWMMSKKSWRQNWIISSMQTSSLDGKFFSFDQFSPFSVRLTFSPLVFHILYSIL